MSTQLATLSAAPRRIDGGLPRLLRGAATNGRLDLDAHLQAHGHLPREQRHRRREGPLIELLDRAGLRGRGGGGFPTATKLRAVAGARRRAIVVVNAAEGEPASLKDCTICQMTPQLMLDGAELSARAVGADEAIVCVCESSPSSIDSVAEAIEERRELSNATARMRLSVVPSGYVSGQESALVNHLNGAAALPGFTPPMPFEQGVRRRPTLVCNAETLAHVALIARHGADWYRELGTAAQPGSALVTLSGSVEQPGVYEIEHGASLASLVDAAGGTTGRARAALVGGYAGTWIDGSLLHGVALSDEHLAAHGASLGAGVIALLSEHACPVAETARVAGWLADEGAGQCGPCINGLSTLADTLQDVATGSFEGNSAERLGRLASLTRGRGACGHPDGAVRFILSAARVFSDEFADHARHGPCEACAQPAEMPLSYRAATPGDRAVAR